MVEKVAARSPLLRKAITGGFGRCLLFSNASLPLDIYSTLAVPHLLSPPGMGLKDAMVAANIHGFDDFQVFVNEPLEMLGSVAKGRTEQVARSDAAPGSSSTPSRRTAPWGRKSSSAMRLSRSGSSRKWTRRRRRLRRRGRESIDVVRGGGVCARPQALGGVGQLVTTKAQIGAEVLKGAS